VSVAPRGVPSTAIDRTNEGDSPEPFRMTAMELPDPLGSVRNDQPPFAVTTAQGWPGTRTKLVRMLPSGGADAFEARQPGGDSVTVVPVVPVVPVLVPLPRVTA